MTINDRRILWGLGLVTFIFYFFYAWALPITDPVESNYCLTAKEMLAHGSFISPMIFDHAWYDKPPLTYWFLMLSFKLFGYADWAARLPAVLTASASVMAMFAAVQRLTKQTTTALWSALILGTTFEFWYISHAVITDGYLFLASLGIFTFAYLALTENSRRYMRYAYIASAIAVLAKGPVGILLPGIVLVIFLLVRKAGRKTWGVLFDPIGILLFLLVAAPWYVAMTTIHGYDFIAGFLGLHNVTRATLSEHPSQDVWYYYLVLTPIGLLPWLGLTIYERWRNLRTDSLRQFQWIWFLTVFAFYTLVATKYITYTFIGFIPLTILNAQGLQRLQESCTNRVRFGLILFLPIAIFSILLALAAELEPHIHSALMLVTMAVILVTLNLAFFKIPLQRMAPTVLLCAVALFIALPPTIQPLVTIRSAAVLAPMVESYGPDQVYIYHTYITSYKYYTNQTPTRVLSQSRSDEDIWDIGKDVMPTMDIQQFNQSYNPNIKQIFLVEKDRLKKLEGNTTFHNHFHSIGTYDKFIIFANYDVPQAK